MYKILIVDDEKIERNGIKLLLKQLDHEFEVSEAGNGMIALDMIKENEYDILLTDIKMPFMDGMELIEKVYEMKRNLKYIIFSGCSDFSYAKQAVRLGVADYILKPVDIKEFKSTINKVVAELDELKLEQNLKDKSMEFFSEHLLFMATNGAPIEKVQEYNCNLLQLDFVNEFKRLMLIDFNTDFFGGKGAEFRDYIMKREPRISQYLNLNPAQSILFFSGKDYPFEHIAKLISDDIMEKYGEKCFIAISDEIDGYEGIAKAVEEMDNLMENKFYHHTRNIFMNDMNNEEIEVIQVDDDTILKQMKQDIKMKDVDTLREHFARFCAKYSNKRDFSQVYIKFLFSNLLKEFYENIPNTDEKELNAEIETLYLSSDFNTVIEIVNRNIDRLESAFDQNPSMVHKEIEVVKKYIFEHYSEELSVESLGKMVYMAPSYLSSVFKKETGQNLNRFIKAYRMERAKDMLENTMAKIVDISISCGYANVSYFCSSFREYFGISPQKYRETGE